MCGIAGIFRLPGCTDLDVDCVRRMNRLQEHRGPDDEGLYDDRFCVLGHRRLSIIDLSSAGHQPFSSDDGRYSLVFNGEIYNYIELREELQQHYGWSFLTKTDTEVLLKAYIQFGAGCLTRLNGMFAFAVYDKKERSLFLARDRVGIKPLYYVYADNSLTFSSEIKALLALPDLRPSLNYQTLFDYLVFNRTDILDETFICEVSRLPKGCYALFNNQGMVINRWWDPEEFSTQCLDDSLEVIGHRIEELLVNAVRLRMRSDVPVGSCLSGGMDSSILTGILYKHYNLTENYKTFTAAFPGHTIDETHYIDGLGYLYPFKNIRTYPTAISAWQNMEGFVYANDEPTTSPSFFSQYEVMRLAKEHGVSVLLDGQGGDEIFAGYQYFHGFHLYGLLKQKRRGRFISELVQSLIRKQHRSAYQVLLFQLIPATLQKSFLLRAVPYVDRDFFYAHIEKSSIYKEFFRVNGLNQSLLRHFQYKLEHLLRMEDRNSMAFSIEARVPYLDYNIVEYMMGLPESLKIKNGETKYLQKIALSHYTTYDIVNRKDKIGFGTPGEEWMQSHEWQDTTEKNYQEVLRSYPEVFKKGVALPLRGFDRWKINQLAIWQRLFLKR